MTFDIPNPIRSLFVDIAQTIENDFILKNPMIPCRLRLMGSIVSFLNSHSDDSDESGQKPSMILDDGTDLVNIQLSSFIMGQFEANNLYCQKWNTDDQSLIKSLKDDESTSVVDSVLGRTVDCVVRVEYVRSMPDIQVNQSELSKKKNRNKKISERRYELHCERIHLVTNPNEEFSRWLEISFRKGHDRSNQISGSPSDTCQNFLHKSKCDNKLTHAHVDEVLAINDVSEYNIDFGYPMKHYSATDIYRMILSEYKDETGIQRTSSIVYNGLSAQEISLCLDMNIATVEQHLETLQNAGQICKNTKGCFVPRTR